ncbi:hypothetical protein G3480_13235 [Thiorhodococcus mannitoliphagus]|uniref:DNA phosphorothioation-dependent restriction protein DptG n=1 Tax=Thiorhodococcus mannitoliphagus TaxID=329406 RepID=A0A6P1DX23_9GAMM|nr:hypothetical protein [Thiorhodococcus mannitoliphagus]NEX21266.1 hypothetical protein [Thiorhodococcus mannitoliphagus]
MNDLDDRSVDDGGSLFARFPAQNETDKSNPAIRLYGQRFYKDQTPVEYLAEFLLVFSSPKEKGGEYGNSFSISRDENKKAAYGYWPEDRVGLKLFSFFPSSKLETRHSVHRAAYLEALEEMKLALSGSSEQKEETIRFIQSLLAGFVGVAKNRTWATHCFLPISRNLLGRELDWLHSQAEKDANLTSWRDASDYFARDRHNFMARGGELLFLQLANLFSSIDAPEILLFSRRDEYSHLEKKLQGLEQRLTAGLSTLLDQSLGPINSLVDMIESRLVDYKLESQAKYAPLGWVPVASRIEALLFASEIDNICSLTVGALEKIDLLQLLCCMQVLRSLCFQARRFDDSERSTFGFVGNYAWVVSDPDAKSREPIRKLAESSFTMIEALLYRVLRRPEINSDGNEKFAEADKHGFQIFRKISKEINLVIPPNGRGQRFSLNPALMRFLVAALVQPGEYLRLTDFYHRVFAHYGIALGGEPLAVALAWCGSGGDSKNYAVDMTSGWVEETLQQGGFLIELSDAVSIVHNPGSSSREWS